MKRYAIVGTGGRHKMYRNAIFNLYGNSAELVGLSDINTGRGNLSANAVNQRLNVDVPFYHADRFAELLSQQSPDTVIVTTMDSTHDDYICASLAAGCDVITEKPLTTTIEKLKRIIQAQESSGREITVAFNYRYSPVRSRLKQLLMQNVIGDIYSVDFQWLLDTRHGADYFRRWHRQKKNSGGLLVHKATHHFDLVNWWLNSVPETISASGALRYYTPAQAIRFGLDNPGTRCQGCPEATQCRFHTDIKRNSSQKSLYLDQEHHDGYHRDQCVFSADTDIEDTMSVQVDYRNGTHLNYALHAYSPWEGYRIAFNGSQGRIEHELHETPFMSNDDNVQAAAETASIKLFPEVGEPQDIAISDTGGDHGGGDAVLLDHLFSPGVKETDELNRYADYRSGGWSIIVGLCANISIESGENTLIRVADLVPELRLPDGVI